MSLPPVSAARLLAGLTFPRTKSPRAAKGLNSVRVGGFCYGLRGIDCKPAIPSSQTLGDHNLGRDLVGHLAGSGANCRNFRIFSPLHNLAVGGDRANHSRYGFRRCVRRPLKSCLRCSLSRVKRTCRLPAGPLYAPSMSSKKGSRGD